MIKRLCVISFILLFTGCSYHRIPIKSHSITILLKTPSLKFYDRGFIHHFDDHTQLQIFNAGKPILDLKLYENRICQSQFTCLPSQSFNKQHLHSSYPTNFLKNLIEQNQSTISFHDLEHKIRIKIIKSFH